MTQEYIRVLSIAGSDSGGGAGIQADLKTLSALGCFGMTAITAVTAQNTTGVVCIEPLTTTVIQQQISAVLEDLGAHAIKIGMLFSDEIANAVYDVLLAQAHPKIVLDPVMVAKGGARLLEEGGVTALKRLFPLSLFVTPNIPEAEVLLGTPIITTAEMVAACQEIANLGPKWILLKGGHLDGQLCSDVLYDTSNKTHQVFSSSRIATANTHGTGCTLSAALAAFLAQGYSEVEAVAEAREYCLGALKAGVNIQTGKGSHGPLHHFFKWW